jgi:hypothetical protein
MTIRKWLSIKKGILPYGFINVTAPQKGHRGSLNHKFKLESVWSNWWANLNNDIPGGLFLHKADIFWWYHAAAMEGKYRRATKRAHICGVDAIRVAAAIIPVCGFEAWIKFNRFF